MDFIEVLASQSRASREALGSEEGTGAARTSRKVREEIARYWDETLKRLTLSHGVPSSTNAEAVIQRFRDAQGGFWGDLAPGTPAIYVVSESEFWTLISQLAYAIQAEYDAPSQWELFEENLANAIQESIQDLQNTLAKPARKVGRILRWIAVPATVVGAILAGRKVFGR